MYIRQLISNTVKKKKKKVQKSYQIKEKSWNWLHENTIVFKEVSKTSV